MDFNTWLQIIGALVFTAGIFTLYGHSLATDECQRNMSASREGFDNERKSLQAKCRNVMNEQVKAYTKLIAKEKEATLLTESIRESTNLRNMVIDALMINNVFKQEHLTDPLLALADLIKSEHQAVLDVNSPEIKRLLNKTKREHGKKVRKAADRKLEKTEREYEQYLKVSQDNTDWWRTDAHKQREHAHVLRQEFSMYQGMVMDNLEKYIRLPSVRNACIYALNEQHKAYKEL